MHLHRKLMIFMMLFATIAAPSIDMAKISHTVNKLLRFLDTNTDVILDNNNFSSQYLPNDFFIELGEKMLVSAKLPTDSLASIKLISQKKLCCTFNTKALASQFISACKIFS